MLGWLKSLCSKCAHSLLELIYFCFHLELLDFRHYSISSADEWKKTFFAAMNSLNNYNLESLCEDISYTGTSKISDILCLHSLMFEIDRLQ